MYQMHKDTIERGKSRANLVGTVWNAACPGGNCSTWNNCHLRAGGIVGLV
jgi:hypothetical protein